MAYRLNQQCWRTVTSIKKQTLEFYVKDGGDEGVSLSGREHA